MRGSRAMPLATRATSAPDRSQIAATVLMKLILVARNALAAYLISSAEARSVETIGTAPTSPGRGRNGGGVKVWLSTAR